MGNYQQHLAFGIIVGACSGALGFFLLKIDLLHCSLAFMLGAFGAILPDLDHDESIPLREVFNVAAAVIPFIVIIKLMERDVDMAILTVIFGGGYLFIRIVVCAVFKVITKHRGMFHSIPAMVIVGEIVFLTYISSTWQIKLFLAVAGMLGFLSHLVLDALISVGFSGKMISKKSFRGALDLKTKSKLATGFTYVIMIGLLVVIVLREMGLFLM